jgi:hypothetical protein
MLFQVSAAFRGSGSKCSLHSTSMKQRGTVRITPALKYTLQYICIPSFIDNYCISNLPRRNIRLKITLFFCFFTRNLRKTGKKLSITGDFKIEEDILSISNDMRS